MTENGHRKLLLGGKTFQSEIARQVAQLYESTKTAELYALQG